ncbi:hypothetical protein M0802_012006 [Mischocyttarus mexicanus]|nr:hypothetical protein M0802_012006 [Mischocyttarus mexicanus]
MSLYPTLEDMKVDHMMKVESQYFTPQPFVLPEPMAPSAPAYDPSPSGPIYPSLEDYMGLDLTNKMIENNLPEYIVSTKPNMAVSTSAETSSSLNSMVAPLSGQSLGLQRAYVTNGIRELTLCKDKHGKVGLRVHSVNNGIFVCLVSQDSPAALAGLRFGDQILSVNDECVAGYTMDQAHKLFRNSDVNGIKVVVRDRPFERTVTMHKDSSGCIGFQFKNGKIIALNVVGLKDKQVTTEIENGGNVITVTVIPSFIYDHMVKKMSTSLLKTLMDHSVPDIGGRTIRSSIAVDNGRSTEFIRRRDYPDKSQCYECGKEGHLSYACSHNTLGPRDPPPKKVRIRKKNKTTVTHDTSYYDSDSDEGLRKSKKSKNVDNDDTDDNCSDVEMETLSAAIEQEQHLRELEKYKHKMATGQCDEEHTELVVRRKRYKENSYFSDEEDISE